MPEIYQVPDLPPGRTHSAQLLVRRSRFLAAIAHCASIEDARSFIQAQRHKHADATHNCWAFCAGPPGDTARVACSDGGEPRGTAGRPMLSVLLHSGVGELACVVTRHFGGVKLGTAGLARAYQDATRAALADLPLRMRAESAGLRVTLDYRHIDMLRRALSLYEARILRESFDETACFHIAVLEKDREALCRFLHEQSAGTALVDMVSP